MKLKLPKIDIFSKNEPAFGFDLSDISAKIIQLGKTADGYKLLAYGDFNMPKGIMVNDVIMDEHLLVQNIQNMVKNLNFGKINTDRIVASIPESKAFVRVIQVPKMTEEQAVTAVPIEAEQYIPIPIDQAYLDWEIISEHDEKLDILVTAAPKDYVDNLLRVYKLGGLRPVAFEVESAACARALIPAGQKDGSSLILDMNTYRTSIIVVENGHLKFTSSVPIAGDAFTQSISRALGVTVEEAEKIKREVGLDDNKEHQNVKAALVPVVDSLVAEMMNTIKFHIDHGGKPITQIMLCGGTAKLLHLSSYLYSKMTDSQIDIIQGNPWINVFNAKSNEKPPFSRIDSLSYTTAIGLGIRGSELVL